MPVEVTPLDCDAGLQGYYLGVEVAIPGPAGREGVAAVVAAAPDAVSLDGSRRLRRRHAVWLPRGSAAKCGVVSRATEI